MPSYNETPGVTRIASGFRTEPVRRLTKRFSSPVPEPRGRAVGLGQCGRQTREEDVDAAFEFGGPVVRRQHRREAPQQGEVADR